MRSQSLKPQKQYLCPLLLSPTDQLFQEGGSPTVLFRAQTPDAPSLPFLGAGLNIHHLGKEGPRKLVVRQYHQISAVANRYGGRQSSQRMNFDGTNGDSTIVRIHLLKTSYTVQFLCLSPFLFLSASFSPSSGTQF